MNSTHTPVVKKTIPKKTMGYLKFAYWALHQEGDNIQKLFLDRSIDEIIHHVSQIVDHGDQHITINTLHKNLRHLINTKQPKEPKAKSQPKSKAKSEPKAKPEPKSKVAPKAKPILDLPDTIVTQLVTLARQDFNTTNETFGETIPAILKKPRAKKYITETPPIHEPIIQPIVETIVEPIPEPIHEPIIQPIVETIVETFAEPFAETPAQTIKKPKTTPIKKNTEIPTETIANKKIRAKKNTIIEPITPTLPTDQLSEELFVREL